MRRITTVIPKPIIGSRIGAPAAIAIALAITASDTYFLLAVRFWFYAPAIGCGLGLACFIAAASLS
jgi:hypothetical protein